MTDNKDTLNNTLVDNLHGKTDAAFNAAKSTVDSALDKGQKVAKVGIEKLADHSDRAAKAIDACGRKVYQCASDNPTYAILLALGAGALLYHCMSNRCNNRRYDR